MKTLILAKVVLYRDDGKILVLRRSAHMRYRPGELDVAGGMVDEGEDYITAAIREVSEETGLTIGLTDLELIFADSGLRVDRPSTWLFFLARTKTTDVKISEEHVSADWMDLDQAITSFEDERQTRVLQFIRDNHLMPASRPLPQP
jgi:bis(5'-nucleosidyl)-tetraphosphatase